MAKSEKAKSARLTRMDWPLLPPLHIQAAGVDDSCSATGGSGVDGQCSETNMLAVKSVYTGDGNSSRSWLAIAPRTSSAAADRSACTAR